jgi:hypothetical protein
MRASGTYLYGRRMDEALSSRENAEPGRPPFIVDCARVWQAAEKVVYPTTLNRAYRDRRRSTGRPCSGSRTSPRSTSPPPARLSRRTPSEPGWSTTIS